MANWRALVKIKNAGKIELTGLPSQAGEEVEVAIASPDERLERLARWKVLVEETRAQLNGQPVTDEDIDREIDAVRAAARRD